MHYSFFIIIEAINMKKILPLIFMLSSLAAADVEYKANDNVQEKINEWAKNFNYQVLWKSNDNYVYLFETNGQIKGSTFSEILQKLAAGKSLEGDFSIIDVPTNKMVIIK